MQIMSKALKKYWNVGFLTGLGVEKNLYTSFKSLRSGFSISNQIKFDLQFTDLRLTWCSELIVDQLCCVFPCIFDLQLRDRWLADQPSTEPTLCQSDWLRVTSICGIVLMGMCRDQPNSREKMHDFTAEFFKCVKFHGKFTESVSEIHRPHRRYFEVLR